ncbi:hypothetical protein O3M35_005792 [Rhynocoris fuscipes]|uniref:BIG2 domain-containing protein n=1 Tax=Rhynocoris fuscipes TaxID=488301 RepID=A0AAW1DKF5_9HEMI
MKNYCLIILILCIYVSDSAKLNVPRVLLPVFKNLQMNFTLEVTGIGCYKWSSSRPDLISVSNGQSKCSRSAVVTVVTRDMNRNTAVVLAQEHNLGQVLRADVILDTIDSLTLVTVTRKLHLDEPPELFEVKALDKFGNMFTSLLGVEFHWSITNQAGSTSPFARIIPVSESTYEAPQAIRDFELSGKQSYIALLEGIQMGSAKVSAKLPYFEYSNVLPAVVRITVHTNLLIEPSYALIMVGDTIRYKIKQVRGGKVIEIEPLYTKYQIKCLDGDIAETSGFEVTGLQFGHVTLELYDLALSDSSVAIAEAKLSVVNAVEMTLSMLPDVSIVTGEPAVIVATVYSHDNQEILLGTKASVLIEVPHNRFTVSSRSFNGSIISGKGNRPGTGILNGTLITPAKTRSHLTASTQFYVYPELSVRPSPLVFPWHPSISASYSQMLEASGGDGSYTWDTDNSSVAVVSEQGSVMPTGPGRTQINVYMKSHTFGNAIADVIVIEPSNLELIRPLTQVEVDEFAYIYIVVTGLFIFNNGTVKRFAFSNCEHMQFTVKIDLGFRHVSTLPNESHEHGACAVVKLVSSTPAISTISVSFKMEAGNEVEKQTVMAAYERLSVIEPASQSTTLAVGSSRHVVFNGGPISFLCKLKRSVSTINENIWSYNFLVDRHNRYVLKVTCEKLGSGKLVLSLRAEDDCKDPTLFDQTFSASVDVFCSTPSVIRLRLAMVTVCPRTPSNTVFINKNSQVEFLLSIMDSDGHKFDNATSLHYKWSVSNSLASVDDTDNVNLNYTLKSDHIVPGEHYKIVETHDKTGMVHVQVSCQENQVETSYEVIVVNDPKVQPSHVVIYNHPSNKIHLSVSEGSGYYNLSIEPKHIAEAHYDQKDKIIVLSPLEDGEAILNVIDLCISKCMQTIHFKVVSAGFLKIDLPDKVERGSNFEATVQLFFREDYPLKFPELDLRETDVALNVISQNIAEIIHRKIDYNDGVVRYTLRALEVGETSLEAYWKDISSPQYSLQVFPPVNIVPKPLVLAVGAEIQLTVTGGPSPDPGLQFSSSDTTIGVISSSAVVKGYHVGSAVITVNAYCKHRVVCSKDTVELSVVLLTGIQIIVPILQLGIGRSMPAWPVGIPSQLSPLVLGSINPPLSFKWSVSLPGVVRLKDVLHSTNIEITNEDRLSVHVHALKPGRTSIFLTVTGRGPDRSPVLFNSSVEIEVIKTLDWYTPPLSHASLLVAPNTHFTVTTNRDREESILYQDWSVVEGINTSLFGKKNNTALVTKENIVEISPSGAVTVGPHPGLAIIMAKSTSQDTLTQQTVAFILQVKPIYYIMANVITKLDVTGDALNHLPQGLNLVLNITYHDQYGTVFYSAPASIHGRANRFDKIHISLSSNNSLEVSLQRSGSTVISVYDDLAPNMNDFIKLPVGNHINPNKTWMSVGEMICFWSPVSSGRTGIWSADSDVISVTSSGLAVANRLGTAVLTFSLNIPNANILSSVAVEVLPVITVQFGSQLPALTNSEIGATFIVPVRLINERERREHSSLRSGRCNPEDRIDTMNPPFSCELRFNSVSVPLSIDDVFSVQYRFDTKIGEMVCEIMVETGPSHEQSMLNTNVTLRVSVPHVAPESAVLQFHPAYFLHAHHLYLSQDLPNAYLVLTASPHIIQQIQVDSSEPTFLTLGFPTLKFKNTYSFAVSVDSSYWARKVRPVDLYINIFSPLTHQRSKVTVILEKEVIKQSASLSFYTNVTEFISQSRLSLLIAFAVIAISIASAYCYGMRDVQPASIPRSDQWYYRSPTHNELREHALLTSRKS